MLLYLRKRFGQLQKTKEITQGLLGGRAVLEQRKEFLLLGLRLIST